MIDPNGKDGLEIVNKAVFIVLALILIIGYPGSVVAIQNRIPLFRCLNFGHLGLNIIIMTIIMSGFVMDVVVIVYIVFATALIHVNCILKWQIKMRDAWQVLVPIFNSVFNKISKFNNFNKCIKM